MILNGLPWKRTEIIVSFLRLHLSTAFQTLLLTMMATPFLLSDSRSEEHTSELQSQMYIVSSLLAVVFEIASKYCISDSFVDHDGYSISSKGFLPTVVDIMVI